MSRTLGRIAVTALALAVAAAVPLATVQAATKTVTTKTGVVTHGGITTTDDTVGWLLQCQPSHELPDDPIVHPGKPGAAHLHDFWGNASTTGNSTLASQEARANQAVADTWLGAGTRAGTSCNLSTYAPGTAGDTASYWAPVLYANGVKITPGTKAQLYYRAKPTFGTGFATIPQDARMIVGSHAATSVATNPALAAGKIYWECQGNSSKHYPVPPTSCTDLLVNIVFPSCYDGGPMDHKGPSGSDNQHFAYAVDGRCPSGFGVKIPQLSEKFKYTVPRTGMRLELSGDPAHEGHPGGLSPAHTMHADFWNSWHPVALQYLVDRCINARISCGTNPLTPTS